MPELNLFYLYMSKLPLIALLVSNALPLVGVKLWRVYKNRKDTGALEKLLKYNGEDVVNLDELRKKLGVE